MCRRHGYHLFGDTTAFKTTVKLEKQRCTHRGKGADSPLVGLPFRLGNFGPPFGQWRFCRLFVANSDCSGSSGSSPLHPVPMKITRVSANTRETAYSAGYPQWNARFNGRKAYFDNQADLPRPKEIAKWICTYREV